MADSVLRRRAGAAAGTYAAIALGFLGTIVWHKGVHVLIDAIRAMPPGSCEALIFGNTQTFPDYVAQLRATAAGLPVTFRGSFPNGDAAAAFGEIDVLAVPSLWPENSPLVIHE